MGDAGSTFLGFFLGAWSIQPGKTAPIEWRNWLLPLCILAVPWYDMISVVALRLWQGRSPFHADKQHLSHRLVDLGLSRPTAVAVIYLLGAASGLTGLLMHRIEAPGQALLGLQLALWWLAVASVEYPRHFRRGRDVSPKPGPDPGPQLEI
jgi:UDP-GlcNAc:undecaprenyl-phosphate GlcNAc-1-phosphate transferase